MREAIKIQANRRDIRLALTALEALVKDRGMPDHATATSVGKTMRALRDARDLSSDSYDLLVDSHMKRDDDGKPIRSTDGGVQIEDPRAFSAENRKLDMEVETVDVWPIRIAALRIEKGAKGKEVCPRCKQLVGMPNPEQFATLVELGILLEDEASEKKGVD